MSGQSAMTSKALKSFPLALKAGVAEQRTDSRYLPPGSGTVSAETRGAWKSVSVCATIRPGLSPLRTLLGHRDTCCSTHYPRITDTWKVPAQASMFLNTAHTPMTILVLWHAGLAWGIIGFPHPQCVYILQYPLPTPSPFFLFSFTFLEQTKVFQSSSQPAVSSVH